MNAKKIIIVGGVAGGASAAARLRRLDEHAEMVMFERDEHISFANCGLPYYIGGSIQDRSRLLVQTPEAMTARYRLDIRTRSEVIAVNGSAKTVTVRTSGGSEYEESYDYLLLSPGAKPIRPDIPGIDLPAVAVLRNLADADRIKAMADREETRSALIVGGGFIGVEMAENLRQAGLEVTLVQSAGQLLGSFDPEVASLLQNELLQNGVNLCLDDQVQAIRQLEDGSLQAELASGRIVRSELAVLAIGVEPDTGFLRSSGIELGDRGHIRVNEQMKTSMDGVYAVGDAVFIAAYGSSRRAAFPLAGPANKQGRIAADNICGISSTYKGAQGSSIIQVFNLTGAVTGSSEKTLRELGIPHHATYVHPASHAGYYPGAAPMALKLLFGPDGLILGAQTVGADGVDKRIDSIAALMRLKGTVQDLAELELAYAPPYSSAKDPVNMAGLTAENILTGRMHVFHAPELERRNPNGTLLIDVRSVIEHESGHIPGSLHLPVDELRERLHELDPSKELWVYCQVGMRGYTAARLLSQHGFTVRNLSGGFKTYRMFGLEVESGPSSIPGAKHASPALHPPVSDAHAGALNVHSVPLAAALEATVALLKEKENSHADNPRNGREADPLAIHTESNPEIIHATLDACGLSCPGPLIEVKKSMDRLEPGQLLQVSATDPGFYEDVQAWARMYGAELIRAGREGSRFEALLRKLPPASTGVAETAPAAPATPEGSTLIVFSGDLDKAIASFIIANGAASSGKKVTLFFTFWGLNIIRKPEKITADKSLIGKMFGLMMPRGSSRLGMSRMNMGGLGAKMIRGVMKGSGISSLEELIRAAQEQGVEIVACSMSMDVMGLKREELIDGVKVGGVGYYLGKADQSGINLFI